MTHDMLGQPLGTIHTNAKRWPMIDRALRVVLPLLGVLIVAGCVLTGEVVDAIVFAVLATPATILICWPRSTRRLVLALVPTILVGLIGAALLFAVIADPETFLRGLWFVAALGAWTAVALFAAVTLYRSAGSPAGRARPARMQTSNTVLAGDPYGDHGGHLPWAPPQPHQFADAGARDPQRMFTSEQAAEIRRRAGNRCEAVYWDWTANSMAGGWMRCAVRSGAGAPPLEADHVVPHAVGGRSVVENGQALCHQHNVQKGTQIPTRAYIDALVESRRTYFPAGADPHIGGIESAPRAVVSAGRSKSPGLLEDMRDQVAFNVSNWWEDFSLTVFNVGFFLTAVPVIVFWFGPTFLTNIALAVTGVGAAFGFAAVQANRKNYLAPVVTWVLTLLGFAVSLIVSIVRWTSGG